jgi:hypothetical protein
MWGRVEVAKFLLTMDGINVNITDVDGNTPFNQACFEGQWKIVQLLLATDGINVLQADNDGDTPFMSACQGGHLEMVKTFLAMDGVQVNKTDGGGGTALHDACEGGKLEVIKLLVSVNGIMLDHTDKNGNTPLMCSSLMVYGEDEEPMYSDEPIPELRMEIIMLLLQYGAGLNTVPNWCSFNQFGGFPVKRMSLYKHARSLPNQHQPLLDFHSCRLHTQHALVPTSALKTFNLIWPSLVSNLIECFLLPSKKARRTSMQIVSHWGATLNNRYEHEEQVDTQLTEMLCRDSLNTDAIRFLLLQDDIDVNKCQWNLTLPWFDPRTPLDVVDEMHHNLVDNRGSGNVTEDFFRAQELKCDEMKDLLGDAGGRRSVEFTPRERRVRERAWRAYRKAWVDRGNTGTEQAE